MKDALLGYVYDLLSLVIFSDLMCVMRLRSERGISRTS